jgi:hypothetical protein
MPRSPGNGMKALHYTKMAFFVIIHLSAVRDTEFLGRRKR